MKTKNLVSALADSRSTTNGITFVDHNGQSSFLSYNDLYLLASRALFNLQARGLEPGDEVIIQTGNNRDFLILFWACIMGRIIPVPVTEASNDEYKLKLFNIHSTLRKPYLAIEREKLSQLESFAEKKDRRSQFDNMKVRAMFLPEDLQGEQCGNVSMPQNSDIAYIQFSSGSTGTPKGVVLTHQNLLTNIAAILKALGQPDRDEDHYLSWMPLTHDMGVIGFHLTPLVAGYPQTVMVPSLFIRYPHLWLETLSSSKATISVSPNFGYKYVLKHAKKLDRRRINLCHLRALVNGAEPISADLCREFLALMEPLGFQKGVMYPAYGMAEASLAVALSTPGKELTTHMLDRDSLRMGSPAKTTADADKTLEFVEIGFPVQDCSVKIVDENGREMGTGIIGEITISGHNVTGGYYNDVSNTAHAFLSDGWLLTGDLGFIKDGKLVITGRKKEIIFINGMNYYPHDLERTAEEMEEIDFEKVVFCGVSSRETGTDDVIAFVVFRKSLEQFITLAEGLKSHMSRRLGIVVHHVIPIKRTPKTTSGKIKRSSLKERYITGEFASVLQDLKQLQDQMSAAQNPIAKEKLLPIIEAVWIDVLGGEKIDTRQNFFEAGGTSNTAMLVKEKLQAKLGLQLDVLDIFRFPTIDALAAYLSGDEAVEERGEFSTARRQHNGKIAIIGMACRFPGAGTVEEFWDNLINDRDSLSDFSDRELGQSGIEPDILGDPSYVKVKGIVAGSDCFDADFFGYTPAEATAMDPQIRLLHELAWATLESAGCNPRQYKGAIGLYAGASPNIQWQAQALLRGSQRASAEFTGLQVHDKDFMSTRVSYKLELTGPSVTLYSACSTSLVAVDMACQGLLTGRCHMALAGGVSIWLPQKSGYHYEEGMLFSKTGRCRSFDHDADGTIFSDGGGLVALKPLDDALADRDDIHAVILGSFSNNDGGNKAGYTAPGIDGQAAVIRNAIAQAGIRPESVSYIETHGSATQLGDSIELQAMNLAFGTSKQHYCAAGSVKSNIGHLNAAAGIAGLIKTVMALKNRFLPASIHFNTPNPQLPLNGSPFYIQERSAIWESNSEPLRAGVNSFGIGGTNAHVVLEEAPPQENIPTGQKHQEYYLLPLSGRSGKTVARQAGNLKHHLESRSDIRLSDVAYTLQTGRRHFPYRDAVVCTNKDEALEQLSKLEIKENRQKVHLVGLSVVFMFTGLGGQYKEMGQGLYTTFPSFRQDIDHCLDILRPLTDVKLDDETNDPLQIQISMFVFQYALARLLISWGIQPDAMIGYSFGEYTAACLAGTLTLEDALKIVVARGNAMRVQPEGKMVSVPLDRQTLLPYLTDNIYIAIDNGPSCVVAGKPVDIDVFREDMKNQRYMTVEFPSTHAMHSPMMKPMADVLEAASAKVSLKPPSVPLISNLTGTWFETDELTPSYWGRHLTNPVRFADGIDAILKQGPACFIEIGPGHDLRVMVERQFPEDSPHRAVNLARAANQNHPDPLFLLKRLAALWKYGVPINWDAFPDTKKSRTVSLPTYPFEQTTFDISIQTSGLGKAALNSGSLTKKPDITDWFYIPGWKRALRPAGSDNQTDGTECWFVLGSGLTVERYIVERLEAQGHSVISVSDLERFEELIIGGTIPRHIVHCWSVGSYPEDTAGSLDEIEPHLYKGFHSLVSIAAILERSREPQETTCWVISNDVYPITGSEQLSPVRSTIIAPLKTLPQEFAFIHCRHIDLEHADLADPEQARRSAALITTEFQGAEHETIVGYRAGKRWIQGFEPVKLQYSSTLPKYLQNNGVYLLTGGLGNIGFALAGHLARTTKGTLVLTGRSLVSRHKESTDPKAMKLKQLEELGATVIYHQADAANITDMKRVVSATLERCGAINGVIHAAGIMDKSILATATAIEPEHWRRQFPPKVLGLSVLEQVLADIPLDFCLVTSSLSPLLGGIGLGVYAAANVYMDTFVHRHNSHFPVRWTTVNWADWEFARQPGESEEETTLASLFKSSEMNISIQDGVDTFNRILSHCDEGQIIVSAGDMETRVRQWITNQSRMETEPRAVDHVQYKPRPDLLTAFAPPENPLQQTLAGKWSDIFGIRDIGVDDDFFELGGDSLKALTFISSLHRDDNHLIEVGDFFKHPTIRGVTDKLANNGGSRRQAIVPSEKMEYYDLSHAQQRLWIIDQLEEDLVAYNLTAAVEFDTDLDPEALEEAYQKVVARHESLRTIFKLVEGEAKQVVRPPQEIGFSVDRVDLRNHPSAEKEVARLADADKRVPFDLDTGPLLRVTLLQLKDKYIKLFCVHHIVCDGVSLNVLTRDWLSFYRHATSNGSSPAPSPLTLQYRDFSHWHNHMLAQESLEQHRGFWRETLAGDIHPLELPADFPRPDVKTYNGSSLVVELEPEARLSASDLCKRNQASMFMLLFATVKTLLFSYSGQKDMIVGAVISGREYGGLDDQVGFYANSLPIRTSIPAQDSFESYLLQVRDHLRQAYQHQIFPLDMMVEMLHLNTPPSRNPLFDVIVVQQHIEVADEGNEGDNMIFSGNRQQWASSSFDLTFSFYSDPQQLCCTIRYNTDLFEEPTIQLMGKRLNELFKTIVKKPGASLESLSDIEVESASNHHVATWDIDF